LKINVIIYELPEYALSGDLSATKKDCRNNA